MPHNLSGEVDELKLPSQPPHSRCYVWIMYNYHIIVNNQWPSRRTLTTHLSTTCITADPVLPPKEADAARNVNDVVLQLQVLIEIISALEIVLRLRS